MDDFDLRFYDTLHGRKLFRVLHAGRAIFTGTKGECQRFLRLHAEKRQKELKSLDSPRRQRPYLKRYRVSTRRAAAF